jgi:hypothetical protein
VKSLGHPAGGRDYAAVQAKLGHEVAGTVLGTHITTTETQECSIRLPPAGVGLLARRVRCCRG